MLSWRMLMPAVAPARCRPIWPLPQNTVGAPSMPTHCRRPITATSPPMRIRLAAGLITVRSCPYWVCVSGCWACSDVTVASTTVNISCIRFISFLFAIRFMLFAVCIMLFAVCLFAMCFTLSRRQSAARKWQYLIPQHEPPLLVFPFPAYLDLCHVEVGPFFLLYRRPDEGLHSH